MLPLRHRKTWLALSGLLVAGVVFGSLQPNPPLVMPGNFDKVEHFAAYFLLAGWFTGLYPRSTYWTVAIGLLVLGIGLEVLQGAMELGRVPDVFDMAANAAGVAVGVALALVATGGWARRVESWLSSS
jgi:VanZ family protein